MDMSALLMNIQPTYIVCSTGITVWLGLIINPRRACTARVTVLGLSLFQ